MKTVCMIMCIIVVVGAGAVLSAYVHPVSSITAHDESPGMLKQLEDLGDSALISRDVPVAAILMYGRTKLGTGYNTVARDGNAGGHAEINAISSALRAVGDKGFTRLDRDSLLLVTSFEPCAMCRGALVTYNIRNVEILKTKSAFDLMKEDLKILRYYWHRAVAGPPALQDTLFRRHPDYHGG